MPEYIVTLILGIVFIVIGRSNRRGNISSLHSYHRKRVSEEDRLPFGRQVGLGTMIIGAGLLVFSAMCAAAAYFEMQALTLVGTVALLAFMAVGCVIVFHAMIKYNKGIF